MSRQPKSVLCRFAGVPKFTCQIGVAAVGSFASNAYTLLATVVTYTRSRVPPSTPTLVTTSGWV